MGDEGGMTRGDGGSQREREREKRERGVGWGGEGGRERWRTSRSLRSIRIKHPPVRKKFGVFTPQTRCCPQTSQLRRKCAEKRQTAEKWTFSSPSDLNRGRVQAELTRRSAFIPTPAAVGTPCFCETFLQLSRSWETQSKFWRELKKERKRRRRRRRRAARVSPRDWKYSEVISLNRSLISLMRFLLINSLLISVRLFITKLFLIFLRFYCKVSG